MGILRVRLLSELTQVRPTHVSRGPAEIKNPDRNGPVKLHIAPWALTNEDTPIHVQWKPDFDFDEVTITIPDGFIFVEFTNVEEVKFVERAARVKKTNVERSDLSHYFGCVVRCVKVPKDIRFEGKIDVSFLRDGGEIYSEKLSAKIFRPKLTFSEPPGPIELTDQKMVRSLPIQVGYRGFGDIQLRVEAIMEGQIVSEAGTVALEILRRLWLFDTLPQQEGKAPELQKGDKIGITPDYVKAIAAEVERILDTGEIPAGFFEEEVLADIKEWLGDIRNRDRFMDLLYSHTEDMLLNLLMDLLESHPASNVNLVTPKSKILTHIRAPLTDIVLRLRYRDLLKNEYEPVEVTIKMIDKRVKSKPIVEVPIVITKWDDRPLLNVAGM